MLRAAGKLWHKVTRTKKVFAAVTVCLVLVIGVTLGAAGITESIFCFLAMQNHFLPQSLNTRNLDPQLSANIAMSCIEKDVRYSMSNSFGFGGSNCSLLFGLDS